MLKKPARLHRKRFSVRVFINAQKMAGKDPNDSSEGEDLGREKGAFAFCFTRHYFCLHFPKEARISLMTPFFFKNEKCA